MDRKILVREMPEKSPFWISRQELKIVESIQEGFTNKEIAERLGLTERTVETHRHNILKRLDCRNTAQLLTVLFRQGIIS